MMSMMAVDSLRNLHINSWRVKNKNGESVANQAKQGHHRHQHSLEIEVGFKSTCVSRHDSLIQFFRSGWKFFGDFIKGVFRVF